MDEEDVLNMLLEEGYTLEEAREIIDNQNEEDHLTFFRFQELYNRTKE